MDLLIEMESLLEARTASLYHACGFHAAIQILGADKIEARTRHVSAHGHDVMGVSLTRSPQFAGSWGDVVFEIDQQLLIYHHKVIPVDFWGKSNEPQLANVGRRRGAYAEAEEFVMGPINELSRMLKAIRITKLKYGRMAKTTPTWIADNPILFQNPKLNID